MPPIADFQASNPGKVLAIGSDQWKAIDECCGGDDQVAVIDCNAALLSIRPELGGAIEHVIGYAQQFSMLAEYGEPLKLNGCTLLPQASQDLVTRNLRKR